MLSRRISSPSRGSCKRHNLAGLGNSTMGKERKKQPRSSRPVCERKRRRKNRETSREEDPVIHYIFRAYNIDIPPKWARDRRENEIKFGERVQREAEERRGETEEGRREKGVGTGKRERSNFQLNGGGVHVRASAAESSRHEKGDDGYNAVSRDICPSFTLRQLMSS